MLTSSDIKNKRFEKSMSGYRPEDVSHYLAEVAAHVELLMEDKADLQQKLEILAEKMEQYREDEDSLRAALIGAQKLGDSVVRDAKRKAESIIAQATRKSEEIVTEAKASIDREAVALNKMQMEVARFKGQLLQMYKQHIELIQNLPVGEDILPEPVKSDLQFVANIGETVEVAPSGESRPKDQTDPEFDGEPELTFEQPSGGTEPDAEIGESRMVLGKDGDGENTIGVENPDAFPKRKSSRFGTLRFGDAYGLTRKE